MSRVQRVERELQRDVSGQELNLLRRRAHLPEDYDGLNQEAQWQARKSVLTSWFDPNRPEILCSSVDNYIAALFLWVEFYMKPAGINGGVYHFDDPENKYDMVRLVMQPPLAPSLPATSIVQATRRVGKTQTIVREMIPMMVICRPFTMCLVSESTGNKTQEELQELKQQVEENERIHADFGGSGELFPRNQTSGSSWNSRYLQFLHYPRCGIKAYSQKSSIRGKGFLFTAIDDPEDEETTYNVDWRRSFFHKLLHVFVPMSGGPGGKLCWIATPIHAGSCVALASKGLSEKEGEEAVSADKRFTPWRKGKFSVIYKDEDGAYQTTQEQRWSVKGFEEAMRIDPLMAKKEILCEPVTPGMKAFCFDPCRHGYIHYQDNQGDWFLDLNTGRLKPWKEFLQGLHVAGAGDQADSTAAEADPGALVYIGVDAYGVVYVLDAFEKRCHAEDLITVAYALAESLNCTQMGWEKAGLLTVINRLVQKHIDKLRERGLSPPVFQALNNAKRDKTRRILTLIPLFGDDRFRFPILAPVEVDGKIREPVDMPRRLALQSLRDQIEEFTDEGLRGHDDLIDALEMAVRLVGSARGEAADGEDRSTETILGIWRKLGLDFPKETLPYQGWTPDMVQEHVTEVTQSEPELVGDRYIGSFLPW
jgi:hypothetical protein